MADPRVEEALPGYEVGGELGRGAMGEVIAARHVRLERSVAIKRLPPVFADDPAVRIRFADEAKVLAALNHPHIVPVYDYVEERGLCLLVMQALPGGTVWDRFSTEGLSMPAACAVVVAACAGLQHAHDKHVLHRDVKPENLMFDGEHVLKVTDFGIATVLGGEETLATLDGQVIGTPAYMAPEQAQGQTAGPPADVYAAGTMLYELLSGRLPFADDGDVLSLLRRRVLEDPEPLERVAPAVPPALAEAVMTAIADRPEDRFATAEQFGVAVALAATNAWGHDWLQHTELPLLAGGAMSAAATTASPVQPIAPLPEPVVRSASTAPAPETRRRHEDGHTEAPPPPGAPRPDPEPARGTVQRDDTAQVPRDETIHLDETPPPIDTPLREDTVHLDEVPPAVETPPPDETVPRGETVGVGPPPPERVHPTITERPPALDINDVDERDLVPLSDILTPPPTPRLPLALLAILLLALVLAGFVGLGGPGQGDSVAKGQLFVQGVDVTSTDTVKVDLSKPIEIRVGDDYNEAGLVDLKTSVAGLPTGASSVEALSGGPGKRTASVRASSLRRVTSGDVPAELRLTTEDGAPLVARRLTLEQESPQYLNGDVVAAAVISLFVIVYFVSITRPLRLGRRRRSAYPALAVIGAFGGLAIRLWEWSLFGPAPTIVSLILVVVLGAAAAPLAGWCLFVLGRRRRLRAGAA